jgi:CRP-like cAMP-binding protein
MSFNHHSPGDPGTATLIESPLVIFAHAVHPLSPDARAYANRKSFSYRVKKGEFLVRSGELCPYVYFIQKGILRGYVQDGKKEITTWITSENELATSITSFHAQQKAFENIQAIEDSELIGLHYDDLQHLYSNYPEVNITGRKLLEKYYRDAEERAYIARLTEATSKYQRFIATKSFMLNRVPLKFIASYLGMTLETLSRIRSKLSHAK